MANDAVGQDSLVGRTLGHYRIVEEIGAGGMGVVYRAHDEHLDRDVAVKILPPGLLADETARQRFHKEAHALSRLSHPNIATVFDFDSSYGVDFLAEELISGTSLDEVLSPGPLSDKEIVNLGTQLCEGLAAAHSRGVLHRDIKPANLRVTPDGQLKILDFGLAKTVAVSGLSGDEQATLSETQVVAGTLPYMSPEQLRDEKLDACSDIWAAGCVLYEMATGRRPFLGQGTALVDEILNQAPTQPSKLNHKVSPGMEAIIQKCLEKDPALRYGSPHEIAVDLRRLSTSGTFVPAPRKRRPGLYWACSAAVLIVLVLIGIGVWKFHSHSSAMQNKSIAVLSFRNMSGDASLNWLDGGLAELLTTNLSQVKGMDVLSREQIFRVLKRKGRQDAAELSPEMTLDVARDAGADTCVTGSLMKLGPSQLRVDLHVQDTRTGKILFSDKVESEDINGIFAMVDAMTARLAERALPAAKVPANMPEVAEVTTSNVEALRHYQAGEDYLGKGHPEKALQEYEEAVRLDPQFARAYRRIYLCYADLEDGAKADETLQILERLEPRLPRVLQLDLERLKAVSAGDWQTAIQVDETLAHDAPRYGLRPLAVDIQPDQPERAIALVREAIALDPSDPNPQGWLAYLEAWGMHETAAMEDLDRYQALLGANEPAIWDTRGDLLFFFGHDEEAAAAYRRAVELDPNWPSQKLALAYADQGKHELAAEELRRYKQRAAGASLVELPMFESQLSQTNGDPERALAAYPGAIAAFAKERQAEDAYQALSTYATLALLLGQEDAALTVAREQRLPGAREQMSVSMLEAAAGNEVAAEAALQQYAKANPEAPPFVIEQQRDFNAALVALRHSDHDAALRILPNLNAHTSNSSNHRTFLSFFVRGRVRLLADNYAGAESDFRAAIAYVRNIGLSWLEPTALPLVEQLSHFYLGQIYEQAGKRDDAIQEYQKFLTPYAKSTSRLPQIAEARAALKRLR